MFKFCALLLIIDKCRELHLYKLQMCGIKDKKKGEGEEKKVILRAVIPISHADHNL